MTIEERAEEALRDWAASNEELGWGGSTEVAEHAHEIVGWLSDQALLRLDGPAPADPDEREARA